MIAPRFFPEFRQDTHLNAVDYLISDWTSQDDGLTCDALPVEVPSPLLPRKQCARSGIAEWLVERLDEPTPTLVGIDDGFSSQLR